MTTRIFNGSLIALALGVASWSFAAEESRNPTGETANYGVVKDAARTSGMVQSGSLTATVADHVDGGADGPSYNVKIDYTFKTILGSRSGSQAIGVPDAYFTPEFMASLRTSGHYESSKFKVDYVGVENATTADGHSYPNCDKIKIYDIQQAPLSLAIVAQAMLGAPEGNTIDNMVIVADIFQGVPVLGAVKLDVSGKYSGMNVKAGADYQAP